MIQEPTFNFPALRLNKGGRQQFVANWSLKTILFVLGSFATDATHGAGLRLNHPRVRKIANKWLTDDDISMTDPLTIFIRTTSEFNPSEIYPDSGFGTLSLPIADVFDVCDGVHRIAALKSLNLNNARLTSTEWPVELIECSDSLDAGQLVQRMRN